VKLLKSLSSGICHIVHWNSTNVSEKHVASTFTIDEYPTPQTCLLPASCWFLAWFILQPWRWSWHVPPNSWLTFNRLQSVISQKTLHNHHYENLKSYMCDYKLLKSSTPWRVCQGKVGNNAHVETAMMQSPDKSVKCWSEHSTLTLSGLLKVS
jgi:hypothetical protein